MSKYGIPYMGSKAKIIEELSKLFPKADHFYDLFGGGFSVSHFMLENRANDYKTIIYNEILPGYDVLIRDAIAGKYDYSVFKPEFVTRERFFNEKENNAYVKSIWSFGNDGRTYLFGKEIEKQKESMHNAVIFNKFDNLFVDIFKFDKWPETVLGPKQKRLYLNKIIRGLLSKGGAGFERLQRLQSLQQLHQLERLQRLEQLQSLEQLQQLELTNLSYDEVEIKPNSIIYCDIPYKSTSKYTLEFNYDKFYNWAASQNEPVFISEYNIDDGRFICIKELERVCLKDAAATRKKVCEKIYVNRAGLERIKK